MRLRFLTRAMMALPRTTRARTWPLVLRAMAAWRWRLARAASRAARTRDLGVLFLEGSAEERKKTTTQWSSDVLSVLKRR